MRRALFAKPGPQAPPAAGPWVKIEPGCAMPESGKQHLVQMPWGDQWTLKYDSYGDWVNLLGQRQTTPTHYAIINPPEAV